MAQRTFSIVKPDAVRKGFTGAILAEIDKAGFQIVAIKKQSISKPQAEGFYYVHKERAILRRTHHFHVLWPAWCSWCLKKTTPSPTCAS